MCGTLIYYDAVIRRHQIIRMFIYDGVIYLIQLRFVTASLAPARHRR